MDEQKNQQQQTANVNVPDYTNEINAMYDAQRQQQLQSLENAYNQNTQSLQSARANIAPTYNKQANDLNAQYERSRMNNNMQAAANGVNTGVGSQMALAQQSNYLDAFGNIRAQQARAEQDLDQQLANLEINYKNSVSQALANNDHERAAALMAEYKRRDEAAKEQQRYNDNWALNKAQTLAQYGNFSGYAELYGQDVADAMQQYFNMMNGGGSSGRGSGYGGYGNGDGDNGNGPGTYGDNDITKKLKNVGDSATDADGNVYKVAGKRKDGSLIIVNQGNGQETSLDILARRSQYANDEQFALGEMSRIRDQAAADASRYAQSQGMRMGSDEYNRFVQLYTQQALANNPDYATYQDMYQNESQRRVSDKKAEQEKATSEYLRKNGVSNMFDASSYANYIPNNGLNNSTAASQWANGAWDELVRRLTSPRNGKGQIISKKK